MVHPDDRERVENAIGIAVNAGSTAPYNIVYRVFRGDTGEQRWWREWSRLVTDVNDLPARLVGTIQDITEERLADEKLQYAASHDPLTGLLNRAAFQESLEALVASGEYRDRQCAYVLVDVDHFKDFNDTLGHDAGDTLLRIVADRLTSAIGPRDLVARLGGDEFAVLSIGSCSAARLNAFTAHIADELQRPFTYRDKRCSVTVSLGVAPYDETISHTDELMKNADLALYAAKQDGRGRSKMFRMEMRRALERRGSLFADIRQGLANGQFEPFYQPKVDLRTGRVVGFEALCRWVHPERGVLTPQVFGPAFADGELALAIGETMFRQIVTHLAEWRSRGHEIGRVAFNLTSFDFSQPRLAERLIEQLGAVGVPSSMLQIEVTEAVFFETAERGVASTLQRLHERGVTVALDDFGTGYASLAHLKRLPVDELKIDKGFVRNLEHDAGDAAIASAIIGLAGNLKLAVVAEGVETMSQVQILRDLGCGVGQGFLFSKPMPASRVPWLARHAGDKLSSETETAASGRASRGGNGVA